MSQLCIHFILNRPQLCSDLLHSCLQLVLQLVDQGFTSTTIYWCLTGKQKESVHLIRSFSKALVSTHHKPVSTPGDRDDGGDRLVLVVTLERLVGQALGPVLTKKTQRGQDMAPILKLLLSTLGPPHDLVP